MGIGGYTGVNEVGASPRKTAVSVLSKYWSRERTMSIAFMCS